MLGLTEDDDASARDMFALQFRGAKNARHYLRFVAVARGALRKPTRFCVDCAMIKQLPLATTVAQPHQRIWSIALGLPVPRDPNEYTKR